MSANSYANTESLCYVVQTERIVDLDGVMVWKGAHMYSRPGKQL